MDYICFTIPWDSYRQGFSMTVLLVQVSDLTNGMKKSDISVVPTNRTAELELHKPFAQLKLSW